MFPLLDSKQVTSGSLDAAVNRCSNSKKTCNIYSTKCLLNSAGVVDSMGWVFWVEWVCELVVGVGGVGSVGLKTLQWEQRVAWVEILT